MSQNIQPGFLAHYKDALPVQGAPKNMRILRRLRDFKTDVLQRIICPSNTKQNVNN